MPAIIFGTDQLPDGFGDRLPSSCVKLCHVRSSTSFSPKLSRYEIVPGGNDLVIGPLAGEGDCRWLVDGSYAVNLDTVLICANDPPPRRVFVPGFGDGRRWLDGPRLASEKDWPADVAELVDARDLKSLSYGYPGSIPGVRTSLYYGFTTKPAIPGGPFGI
jgi:hypothetical protein